MLRRLPTTSLRAIDGAGGHFLVCNSAGCTGGVRGIPNVIHERRGFGPGDALGIAPGFVHVVEPITFGYREHDTNVRRDLSRTLSGLEYQLDAEETGQYPGGPARRGARLQILGRQVRPLVFSLLRSGDRRAAWALYRRTFRWQLQLGRLHYLLGYPIVAMFTSRSGSKAS